MSELTALVESSAASQMAAQAMEQLGVFSSPERTPMLALAIWWLESNPPDFAWEAAASAVASRSAGEQALMLMDEGTTEGEMRDGLDLLARNLENLPGPEQKAERLAANLLGNLKNAASKKTKSITKSRPIVGVAKLGR